jgi:Sulfotransferase family
VLHRTGAFAPWEDGFDLSPPTPGPGEQAGPPDFVGIGVQKGGTSWWYELIADHPGVSAGGDLHKERHYLSHFGTAPFGPHRVQEYHGWFPRRPGTIAGEWTPDYLGYPWVAALLAEAAPGARLLVILRDPVERFRSGLSFRLSQGALPTEATEAEAVRQGFYARSLKRYLEHFPPGQFLVLQYEQCAEHPAEALAATYRFLGLDDSHRPEGLRRGVNVSGAKVPLDDGARQRLVELYGPDVDELVTLFPSVDPSYWPNFGSEMVGSSSGGPAAGPGR